MTVKGAIRACQAVVLIGAGADDTRPKAAPAWAIKTSQRAGSSRCATTAQPVPLQRHHGALSTGVRMPDAVCIAVLLQQLCPADARTPGSWPPAAAQARWRAARFVALATNFATDLIMIHQ